MRSKAALLSVCCLLAAALLAGAQDSCIASGLSLLNACSQERDYVTGKFQLNSPTPISQQQVQEFVAGVPAGLPTPTCCTAAGSFTQARCQCDQGLLAVLPAGGVTPQGLAGVLEVVSITCKLPGNTTC